MQRTDLLKLVGADGIAEYTPVAFLLKNGYACAGNFNAALNADMTDTCVLLNCRMVELSGDRPGSRGISDFNEFLEDLLTTGLAESSSGENDEFDAQHVRFGRPVPIVAVPLAEVAVLYPIAHIETLIHRASEVREEAPAESASDLLDFKKSEILAVLTTKLW